MAEIPWLFCSNLAAPTFVLSEEEARHATQALRMRVGDSAQLFDGYGLLVTASVLSVDKKGIQFLEQSRSWVAPRPYKVHLAIAPTKNADRMEWLVEKCVEMGLDSLVLLQTERTERHHTRLDRLTRIAISALKQSQQVILPQMTGPISMVRFLKDRSEDSTPTGLFICHCDAAQPRTPLLKTTSPYVENWVLIGPEGDFSLSEIEQTLAAGGQAVQLGKTRLRTETAGLVAVHTLHLQHEL